MNQNNVDISVIIATYNNAASLRETLESFQRIENKSGCRWELIVVNNNSQDETEDVVKDFSSRGGLDVVYHFTGEQGKPYAMNDGIRLARGEVIASTDDDCRVEPDYIDKLAAIFRDPDVEFAGGKILPIWEDENKRPSWLKDSFLGPLAILDYGDETITIDRALPDYKKRLFYGANIAFRKSALEKHGLFATDKILAEDTELCLRLIAKGCRGLYCPDLCVHHKIPVKRMTPQYFHKWYFTRGYYREYYSEYDFKKYHLLGIPFWLLKESGKELWNSLTNRDSYQRVFHRCQFYMYLGIMKKRIQVRSGA